MLPSRFRAIVPVVQRHVLQAVIPEIVGNPVRHVGNVLFRYVVVVTRPAAPVRGRPIEVTIGLAAFTRNENRTTAEGESKKNAVQFASLDSRTADLFITSLRANGVAKILAEPAFVSTEGRPARFRGGGEFPVLVPQSEGTTSIEFREFGTSVDFTATKQAGGKLRLDMRVVRADIDASRSVTIDGNQIPGLKSRSIDTAFEVLPGQTAIFREELGSGLLIMVTPELVEPIATTTQPVAAQPNPVAVEQPQPTPTDLPLVAPPAPAARTLPSPPLPVAAERAKIARTALVYKVDSASLAADGIDLGKEFSDEPTDPYQARTPRSMIDARRLMQLTRLLSKANGVDILSRPQVLAMSGQPAQIEVGSEVQIPTPGSVPPALDESHKVGVSIKLVSVSLGDGKIHIDARVDHSYLEDDKSLKSTTLLGKADLFTGETLVVYEEGNDVLLFVTPRLVDSGVASTPSPATPRQLGETPLPPRRQATPTTIPRGMRIVSVPSADRIDVEPGELVDVIGIPTSNESEPTILLAGAQVFFVGQDRAALMMASADAAKIFQASENGTIRLVRAAVVSSVQEEAEDKLRQLEKHLGPRHPSVQELKKRIDNLAEHSATLQSRRTEREQNKQARSFEEFEIVAKELFQDAKVDLRAIGNGVILSGTVTDHEQDRVLSAIAEDLFPNVINNLRTISSGYTTPADNAGTLQETLAELFPDAEIKVRPLRNSVVLSGTIDRELADQSVRITEDFSPQVLDHTRRRVVQAAPVATKPHVANRAVAAEQPAVKSTSINEELRELREDVRVLRHDVSRLIDILEDRDSSSLKAAPGDQDQSSNISADADEANADAVVWQLIGIRVEQAQSEFQKYRGGLKIVELRPESPAAKEGIQQGDILVGLDKWETVNRTNLHFIVGQIDESKPESLKFYVLRGGETLFGHMKLATLTKEPIDKELWDVTLDEVIAIGLQNSRAIQNLGGVTPFEFDGTKKVVLSRVNKDVSLADFETAVRNQVSDTEGAYWELWAAQRDLDTAKQSRDAAQVLWNQINERMRGGIVDVQAEARAREQYFFFRAQLQSALKQLYTCEGKLHFLIGLASSDGRMMRAADEPTTDKYTFCWDDSKKNAFSNSLALRRQRQVVRQAELELTARKNSLLPRGDLAGMYTWNNGLAGEGITVEGLAAKFGLEIQLPAVVRQEAAAVKNAELKVARAKAVLEDMEKNALQLLTRSMRDADFFYQLAQTHFNRSKATTTEVESTTSYPHNSQHCI